MKSNNQFSVFLLFLLCFSINLFGQISIEKFPEDYQIFQRNNENQANIAVKGNLPDVNSSVTLKVFLNGNTVFEQTQNGNFSFSPSIQAGRNNYIFKLFHENIEIKKAENIACGDIYVFYGQSNAIGEDKINEYLPSENQFLRFYHVIDYFSKVGAWQITSQSYDRIQIGLFPMEFQKLLSTKNDIPIGVIQGAVGGIGLYDLYKFDNENHLNPYSYYGKLLTKLEMAGAKETAKYLIFRHGETDATGESQSLEYANTFDLLYKNLNSDLPSLSKIYNYQVNVSSGTNNPNAGILREFQRKTKYLYQKITTLTNIGNVGYEGIHYKMEGYLEAAANLARIIDNEVYFHGNSPQIYHPDIKKASFSDGQITLEFDTEQQMVFPENQEIEGQIRSLSDYFIVDGKLGLISFGYAEGNKIILNLNNYSNPKKITYLPSVFNGFLPTIHNFVLKNSIGMGAFSFENFDISGSTQSPCTKDIVLNFIPETSYIAAGNSIKTMILVSKSKELTLSAKNVVDLEDGFDSEIGTNFTAEIGGCGNLN